MAVAWLVTLLALCGVAGGVFLGRAERFADQLAAAGGGLLLGIALFWLVPEVGDISGYPKALLIPVLVASVLALIDTALTHSGHSARQGFIWPLLAATAVHSLLDGWSVRMLNVQPVTNIAVTAGLVLHKIPEGAALGWVARRSSYSAGSAFLICSAVELCTLAGAFAEPGLNASGAEHFGMWWTVGALSVIAGGFLFLGLHAIIPAWRRPNMVMMFLATLLLVGALTFVRSGRI